MYNLLVVDDEKSICNSLKFAFEDEFDVTAVSDENKFESYMKSNRPDLVLLDLRFGELDGVEILERIIKKYPDAIVIMMTAYASIESSIRAIKAGAHDYIIKPIDLKRLKITIEKAVKYIKLQNKVIELKKNLENEHMIIGKSPAIQNVFSIVDKLKSNDVTVLIEGESGTGKELIARAIHDEGKRSNMNFEAINCGAIPQNLIESELFGYEKNAFTGASSPKKGRIEMASGGTIFLDEIGETDMNFQVKLLRVLQEKVIFPLGSEKSRKVDVRIIAATNKILFEEVQKGNFREDLYYRLNVMKITAPTLSDRKSDIHLLVDYFIKKANKNLSTKIIGITDEAAKCLEELQYPGNVRELENIVYRGCILSEDGYIQIKDLNPKQESITPKSSGGGISSGESIVINTGIDMKEAERIIIIENLKANGGNKALTAKKLGISERNMRSKCKLYGV